jgi:hypothetical protein
MARTISVASRLYAPGSYGPFSVDSLTNANTVALEFTMSVGVDWPTDRTVQVAKVTMLWDSGGGGIWTFNGGLTNQDGTPRTLITERAMMPTEGDGAGGVRKRAVAGGSLSVQVFQPITSAITVAGV